MLSYLWMRADVKGAWLQGSWAGHHKVYSRAALSVRHGYWQCRRQWHFLKGFLSKVPCKLHTTDPWIHRFDAWCFSEITQTFETRNKLELGWGTHMNFRAGGWRAWTGVTQPEDCWQSFYFSLPLVTYTKTQSILPDVSCSVMPTSYGRSYPL